MKRPKPRTATPSAEKPKVGDTQSFPILGLDQVPSPTLVDNCVVSTTPQSMSTLEERPTPHLELLCFRIQSDPLPQSGKVVAVGHNDMSVEMGAIHLVPRTYLSGRMRMSLETSMNLALAILDHVQNQHGIPPEVISDRLLSRGIGGKGEAE